MSITFRYSKGNFTSTVTIESDNISIKLLQKALTAFVNYSVDDDEVYNCPSQYDFLFIQEEATALGLLPEISGKVNEKNKN